MILKELNDGNPVVFFISGGSALETEATIISKITQSIKNPDLTILPVDERFGIIGHENSNIASLKKLLPDESKNLIIDILGDASLDDVRDNFEIVFSELINNKSVSVALLGIGQDGHTAGILNNSPAETSTKLVESYVSDPYTRLTLTKNALSKIDYVYVSAYGPDKQNILQELFYKNTLKPMKILKDLNEVKVYTDNIIKRESL